MLVVINPYAGSWGFFTGSLLDLNRPTLLLTTTDLQLIAFAKFCILITKQWLYSAEIFGIGVLVSDHDYDLTEYCGEVTKWF